MVLSELYLRNFRSYEEEGFFFEPSVNLIVGDNAQGKTNLLEAISYLGSGKSFRAAKTGEMVRFSGDYADINGNVYAQQRQQSLRFILYPDKRRRVFYRNGVKKKTLEDIAGVLPTVLFCPEDLMVLRSGASARRKLCDQALCQLRPKYDALLTEYNRILEQKTRILKDRYEVPQLTDLLPVFNQQLCRVGAQLISYRARFFESLGKEAAAFHNAFSGGSEEFLLEYKTVSTVADPFAPVQTLCENLWEHLQSHYRAELESAQCLTGPHKDDFTVTLSGIDLKAYGSQGQTRTAAISLKLAQRELLAREFSEEPVLLLDDVLSELDPGRQDFVLNRITSGQVFITCCEPGRFTRLGKTIRIEKGKIVR